jgi:hypothetical protein
MATRPALGALQKFILDPTASNASCLVDIPTLHELLQYEYEVLRGFSDAVISTCKWIYHRGKTVLDELIVYRSPGAQTDSLKNDPWYKVNYGNLL